MQRHMDTNRTWTSYNLRHVEKVVWKKTISVYSGDLCSAHGGLTPTLTSQAQVQLAET